MNKIRIRVVEENKFLAPTPRFTTRVFEDDFSTDYFICPECKNPVKITYRDDGVEKWPNMGLKCGTCGKKWSIIR